MQIHHVFIFFLFPSFSTMSTSFQCYFLFSAVASTLLCCVAESKIIFTRDDVNVETISSLKLSLRVSPAYQVMNIIISKRIVPSENIKIIVEKKSWISLISNKRAYAL